jgi:desulfoferrodoxin (superoxide reductase-like protein)
MGNKSYFHSHNDNNIAKKEKGILDKYKTIDQRKQIHVPVIKNKTKSQFSIARIINKKTMMTVRIKT